MTSRKTKRIMNEIKELYDSEEVLKNSGIYFNVNEECIDKVQLLFVGNEDTPYENGFYLFELTYPENYPMIPPKMKYYTQGSFNNTRNKLFSVRFNPNLYTNGKVCLSMLNTWNGPGWVPTNTISNVIVAIQALVLNKYPLQNEPGYEKTTSDDQMSIDYNHYIIFQNYRLSILEVLISINSDKPKIKHLNNFKNDILEEFKKNYQQLNDNLKSYQITIGIKEMKNTIYFLKDGTILDFLELNNNFDLFCNNLKKIDLNSI